MRRISDWLSPMTARPLTQSTVCRIRVLVKLIQADLQHGNGSKVRKVRTYNRPHEVLVILLELLQRILCIAGALYQLRNTVRHLIARTTDTADGRDVVEDTAKLVCCRGRGGNLQLELAALLLCVDGVVASLVFCGGFASG